MEIFNTAACLALAALSGLGLQAQVPTKCLEIESILVDACISDADCPGSSEGMNEMVRFITGPAPIASADLNFTFFSSTFRGITQNALTASLTAQLNATIQGCGFLIEPPGGLIPAGKKVIFITSTAMCVQANPFTALNDTLYIIFQTPGNSAGHFKNNELVGQAITTTPANPLLRWLRIGVNGGCTDTATYDANRLVNIFGSYGGASAENDGATVNFAWPGNPVATYINYGCQAPFVPTLVSVPSGGGTIACGGSANLVGSVTGAYATVLWRGGGGVFGTPSSLATTYTPGGGDNGNVALSFCAVTSCGDTICTSVSVTTGNTPHVTVTGDTTLCNSVDTSILTAAGADTYLWSTGATGPSIVATIAGPMSYWVVGTTSCGTDTAYIAPRWMNTTTYYQNVSCAGAADGELTAHGSGGAEPYSYAWSTGSTDSLISGLAPGSYSYTITDADGCSLTGAYNITEPLPLTATVGADTSICVGGYAVLAASAAGGTPGYTFNWLPEGPLVWPTQTTTYTVLVQDAKGCSVGPLELTVNVGGVQPAFSATDSVGCLPHCVTFTATAIPGATYLWTLGDGSTASGAALEHCYNTVGAFTVSLAVDPGSGCVGTTTRPGLVQVLQPPVAAFNFLPQTDSARVQFTDASTGATAWNWWFGDAAGSTSNAASPSFLFPSTGCYPVRLVVQNDAACTDTAIAQVCLTLGDSLMVPNVFTPNADGNNDVFRITGGNLASLDVLVFNRWGQKVAHIQRIHQAWDGRSPAGEILSEGTYFYILHATGQSGRIYDLNGTVTLVR